MKDAWKTSLAEWLGLALIPFGIFILCVVMRYFIPRDTTNFTVGQLILYMLPGMLTMIVGMAMIAWGGGKRAQERHKIYAKQEADTAAYLTRMKTIYPPNADVIYHLRQLGYDNVIRYIYELEHGRGK